MIRSFADAQTEKIYQGMLPKGFPAEIRKRAIVKLDQLNAAQSLDDMRIPPGNRLEVLIGDRAGQCSIRINDQWRLCFRWEAGNAYDVEIIDYH